MRSGARRGWRNTVRQTTLAVVVQDHWLPSPAGLSAPVRLTADGLVRARTNVLHGTMWTQEPRAASVSHRAPPSENSFERVRRYMTPFATAGVAKLGSPSDTLANSLNVSDADTTETFPRFEMQ